MSRVNPRGMGVGQDAGNGFVLNGRAVRGGRWPVPAFQDIAAFGDSLPMLAPALLCGKFNTTAGAGGVI